MFSNFFDRLADGFMFGLFASRSMCNCAVNNPYIQSAPYIPSVDKNLLNSIFDLSVQNNISSNNDFSLLNNISLPYQQDIVEIPQLPIPLFSASPSIYTPYTNNDIYTFFPPSYQIDYSLLNSIQQQSLNPTFGLLQSARQVTNNNEMENVQSNNNKKSTSEAEHQVLQTSTQANEQVTTVNNPLTTKSRTSVTAIDKSSVAKKQQKTTIQTTQKPIQTTQKTIQTIGNNNSSREFASIYASLGITDTRFQKIFEECILKNEGKERGKDTDVTWDVKAYNKNGILQSTYDTYRKNKKLPKQKIDKMTLKEMCEIYYTMYYVQGGADRIKDDRLALYVFDSDVNMGTGTGRKLLIRSEYNAAKFEDERRAEYKRRKGFAKNGKGWFSRIKKTKEYADKNFA